MMTAALMSQKKLNLPQSQQSSSSNIISHSSRNNGQTGLAQTIDDIPITSNGYILSKPIKNSTEAPIPLVSAPKNDKPVHKEGPIKVELPVFKPKNECNVIKIIQKEWEKEVDRLN